MSRSLLHSQSILLSRLALAISAGTALGGVSSCGGRSAEPDAVPGDRDATSVSPDTTSVNPDATSVSPDTASVNPDATSVSPDTASVNPDATSVSSDATSVSSDATSVSSETLQCEFGAPTEFCLTVESMEHQARYGVGQIPLDPPRSDAEIAAAWDDNGCMKHDWVATGCCNPGIQPGVLQGDGSCCYVACEGACCGRPLVVEGSAITAPLVLTHSWVNPVGGRHEELEVLGLSERARRVLADAWLQDALMEHASIASFAQFSLDLMRMGAPPELLRDSHRAGVDEIDHAQACFSIAARLSGVKHGPGPLDLTRLAVRDLAAAVEAAVHEGCVGETLAAGIAAEQARCCSDPEIRSALLRIAEDEMRHAELAWRFVAWAITAHGTVARSAATRAFAAALQNIPEPPSDGGLAPSDLHVAGRLTQQQWVAAVRALHKDVLAPSSSALLSGASNLGKPVGEAVASA